MKKSVVYISLLLISAAHANIYKWTDSNGIVHYSDTPQSGATQVVLPPSEPATPVVKEANPNNSSKPNSSQTIQVPTKDKAVAIAQPRSEETIRNNQGFVPVIVNVEPELEAGDLLQVALDGQLIGKPQNTKLFAVNNVLRGEHSLTVQLMDAEGKVIATSEPVTIYMHRPRVGMVPATRPNKSLN